MVVICGHGSVEILVWHKNSKKNAPSVLFTSTRMGSRTETHGGWSQDGITLYNIMVEELKNNRKKLDLETVDIGDGVTKSRMDLLEEKFFLGKKLG